MATTEEVSGGTEEAVTIVPGMVPEGGHLKRFLGRWFWAANRRCFSQPGPGERKALEARGRDEMPRSSSSPVLSLPMNLKHLGTQGKRWEDP